MDMACELFHHGLLNRRVPSAGKYSQASKANDQATSRQCLGTYEGRSTIAVDDDISFLRMTCGATKGLDRPPGMLNLGVVSRPHVTPE